MTFYQLIAGNRIKQRITILIRDHRACKHHVLDTIQNADERNHGYVTNHVWLAATYAQLNQFEEAAWEVDQILTLEPDFSLSHWLDTRPIKKIEHRQHLLDGINKAGLN